MARKEACALDLIQKTKVILTASALVTIFLSPVLGQPAQQSTPKQIETLAVVNGKPISRQKVAQECLRRFGEDVLEDIVNKLLVLEECRRQGIVITEKDVNDEIASNARKFGLSVERYIETVTSNKKITVDQMKNQHVWHMMAIRRLAANSIQVSEAEIAERLEYHYGPSVQVRQIVVKTAETARQIQEQALRNPEGFDRLAKKFSIDQNTNGMGGLLLPVRRNSGMPEFENLAFSLQPGQVSEVLPLADVFIVLKCEKHFPAEPLPPQQVEAEKQRIVEELSKSKLRSAALNLFEQMQSTAKIVNVMNDPELGRQMPGVAAQVNGRNIMLNHVAEDCISHYGAQILESEITRQILLDALEQSGLQVSQEDINAEIARAAEANFGEINTDEWLKYVTNNDLSKVEFYIEDEVWPTVAMKKLVEKSVDVTQEDMQKGFDANFGEMVEVLAIVTGDQRSALKVWNMASKNPTADFFGKLAKQYSMEPASKNNYGAVPPIRKNGGQPELEKEAFSLQRGELSKVVQVGKHWLILYCLGRTDPVVTDSDAVKEEIYKDILEKKLRLAMANEFQKLREEAQIDNFLAATSQPGKAAIRQARQSQQGRPAPFTSKR